MPVEPPSLGETEFHLFSDLGGGYFSRNSSGGLALVIPTDETRPPADRTIGGLSLRFLRSIRFEVTPQSFQAPAAVLECLDPALVPTFEILAREIAKRVHRQGEFAHPGRIKAALAEWERLLRSRTQLSREEEIGLWGELWMILQSPDAEKCVQTWGGPECETIDFAGGGVGLECKTSLRRLEHYVAQNQLVRPLGDLPAFIASIWVDYDPIAGSTVNDLISKVHERLNEDLEFEKRLLETGYSRIDAPLYQTKLRILEQPLLFRVESVPRVRAFDDGVSSIRFLAALDPIAALSPARALELLAVLVGETSTPRWLG